MTPPNTRDRLRHRFDLGFLIAGLGIIVLFTTRYAMPFRLDDVLFPTRFRFAVMIAGVDLGRLTRRMTGIEVPGTINADFGRMEYASGRVASMTTECTGPDS